MIRGVRFVHEGQGRQLTANRQGEKLLLFLLFRPGARFDFGFRRLNFHRAALLPTLHFLIDAGATHGCLSLGGLSIANFIHSSLHIGPGAAKGFAHHRAQARHQYEPGEACEQGDPEQEQGRAEQGEARRAQGATHLQKEEAPQNAPAAARQDRGVIR